jgi:hypothetical protein
MTELEHCLFALQPLTALLSRVFWIARCRSRLRRQVLNLAGWQAPARPFMALRCVSPALADYCHFPAQKHSWSRFTPRLPQPARSPLARPLDITYVQRAPMIQRSSAGTLVQHLPAGPPETFGQQIELMERRYHLRSCAEPSRRCCHWTVQMWMPTPRNRIGWRSLRCSRQRCSSSIPSVRSSHRAALDLPTLFARYWDAAAAEPALGDAGSERLQELPLPDYLSPRWSGYLGCWPDHQFLGCETSAVWQDLPGCLAGLSSATRPAGPDAAAGVVPLCSLAPCGA